MKTISFARWALLAFILSCGLASQGAAETNGSYVVEKKGHTIIKYKKKNQYNFEGTDIDGMYNKPAGSYISNIKDVKARSILFVRKNFDAEVMDSARMVH